MPSISPIPIIGHLVFASKMHKLPIEAEWKPPKDRPQWSEGIGTKKLLVKPPKQVPLPFFTPQDMNQYHQDSCDEIGQKWQKFHDTMLDAVKYAVDMFRLQAKFSGLKINAVTALGTPGCLKGPKLESFIKMSPKTASMTGNEKKLRDAVAKGVSKCFDNWRGKVTVPGLPWYPAFAAFPGPQAPPMPNVPFPLIACVSAKVTDIMMPNQMKKEMTSALAKSIKDDDPDKQHETCFESIATALSLAFTIWLASQQVMLCMGRGPIPTFAPPYVPVGPVVMGSNIATPGILVT